jgi:hypothetical protein
MRCNCAPTIQSSEKTVDGALQQRRMVADFTGLSQGLVDHRVKRDDTPEELAPLGFSIRQLRPRECHRAGKSTRDLGCQIGE